jgi:hypothetical protein
MLFNDFIFLGKKLSVDFFEFHFITISSKFTHKVFLLVGLIETSCELATATIYYIGVDQTLLLARLRGCSLKQ